MLSLTPTLAILPYLLLSKEYQQLSKFLQMILLSLFHNTKLNLQNSSTKVFYTYFLNQKSHDHTNCQPNTNTEIHFLYSFSINLTALHISSSLSSDLPLKCCIGFRYTTQISLLGLKSLGLLVKSESKVSKKDFILKHNKHILKNK